jgi:hypothetical protein
MMLVSFGEEQETTREKRAALKRKREQGNEGVETGEMRRNIGILPRVQKGKKSCKQQQQERQRKLRRRRRRERARDEQGMRERVRSRRLRSQDLV